MEYKSHDFYLSACLLASGLVLKRLEPGDGNYQIFVFEDPQHAADKIISEHWRGNNRIPSRSFVEAINELRTRLHGYQLVERR